MSNEVFHAGERAVQDRAGVRALADRIGRSIRAALPPVAQAFLEDQRWLVAGAIDADNRPWATVLGGPIGFVHVVDERTVRIDATPRLGDPLDGALQPGASIGLIAIDLATRRRLRLNGRITARTSAHIVVEADQAYSNCPKYIQRREADGGEAVSTGESPVRTSALTEGHRAWLRGADTFFIASGAPGAGVDASHRGGMPGFITVEGQRITWPDYGGNALFNTLGNIEAWPYAGLLVPDFDTGAGLLVTGRAAIDWASSHLVDSPGAERLVTLDVDAVAEIPELLPARLRLREYSPLNPR
jgi:predicted pyridoxine 5'-phosphate oxidase superfamily flavin-nucleotide-binding protein